MERCSWSWPSSHGCILPRFRRRASRGSADAAAPSLDRPGATNAIRRHRPRSPTAPKPRPHAVAAATGMPQQAGADATLLALYRGEPNAILRREALRRWDAERQPGLSEVARVAAADADPTVIVQALEILERLADRDAAPLLLRILEENRDRPDGYGMPIRAAAIRALGACGDIGSIPALVKELERHEDLSHDNAVVQALARIGHASALTALDGQLGYLAKFNPTESIVQESLREARELTPEARDRISKETAR